MSDIVRDVHQEFWRPPVSQPETTTNLAEACRRCGTEFMIGAAFCHICGANRHSSTTTADSWVSHLGFVRAIEFGRVKSWLGLPVPSLCAFLLGIALLILAGAVSFVTVHDVSDFEAVQLWRIQWLMAACAAFLVGILLKNPKPEN